MNGPVPDVRTIELFTDRVVVAQDNLDRPPNLEAESHPGGRRFESAQAIAAYPRAGLPPGGDVRQQSADPASAEIMAVGNLASPAVHVTSPDRSVLSILGEVGVPIAKLHI